MNNFPLLVLLESVLGKSQHKAKDNYAFFCPFCNHHKRKLEVNLSPKIHKGVLHPNPYKCWVCNTGGSNLYTLFRKLKVSDQVFNELKLHVSYTAVPTENSNVSVKLPDEYIFLGELDKLTGIDRKIAQKCAYYLVKRGLQLNDIHRHQIGFASEGKYAHRIIIPSFDANERLNYYVARRNRDDIQDGFNYLLPTDVNRNIIPFENQLNFNQPIRIVEGVFDAIACRHNAVPLIGLGIPEALDIKLLSGEVSDIYFALDSDAIDVMRDYMEYYYNYGKNVYWVKLLEKDPSESGFVSVTRQFQIAKKYDFKERLKLKLETSRKIKLPSLITNK